MSANAKAQMVEMATFVAQAIFKAADPEADWDELEEAEQQDFLLVAYAAIGAHDAWLVTHGYAIKRLKVTEATRKIIVPRRQLVRPN